MKSNALYSQVEAGALDEESFQRAFEVVSQIFLGKDLQCSTFSELFPDLSDQSQVRVILSSPPIIVLLCTLFSLAPMMTTCKENLLTSFNQCHQQPHTIYDFIKRLHSGRSTHILPLCWLDSPAEIGGRGLRWCLFFYFSAAPLTMSHFGLFNNVRHHLITFLYFCQGCQYIFQYRDWVYCALWWCLELLSIRFDFDIIAIIIIKFLAAD